MKRHAAEHDEAGWPDDFQVGLEEMAVGIDLIRADEDLQIASQMPDDKKKHHAAGGGHDILPSRARNRTGCAIN
jgi:hypothetical protein